MENFQKIWNSICHSQIINSLIIMILSIMLYKGIAYFLNKSEEKSRLRLFTSNKGKTYISGNAYLKSASNIHKDAKKYY